MRMGPTPKAEVNVFLKCVSCGTFITSPSFAVIRKHFNKCQRQIAGDFSPPRYEQRDIKRHQVEDDNDPFEMDCDDFIDEKTETFTFTQPSLVLKRCDLESSFQKPTKTAPMKRSKPKRYNKTIRNSRLIASRKLAKLMKLENTSDSVLDKICELRAELRATQDLNFTSVKITKPPNAWYKCNECSARYRRKVLLAQHKKYIHDSNTSDNFTCSICSRMVKYRHGGSGHHEHLERHEEAETLEKQFNLWKHWPKKPNRKNGLVNFHCKYCLMTLTNNRDFLSHMATDHTDKGEHSPFLCPYNCSTQLDSIKELITHFKSAHPEEYFGPTMKSREVIRNELGYLKQKCEECGQFFNSSYIATHRAKIHSDQSFRVNPASTFSCAYPECKMKCKDVHSLKRHFTLHLEKNPYVCNIQECNSKSGNALDLKRHMQLRHVNASPTCSECGATYAIDKINKHDCEANMKKLESGDYELVRLNGLWRLRRIEIKTKEAFWRAKRKSGQRKNKTDKLDKNDLNDKVNQYIESLKEIDINTIIRSDPGFIQACKNSPGFDKVLFNENEKPVVKSRPFETRRGRDYKCSKCSTMFTGLHGFNKHKRLCKQIDCESSEVSNSTNVPPGEERQLQIGCAICGRSFENDKILQKHLTQDHSPDEVFKCDEPGCGRYFHSMKMKQRHYEWLHIPQPYQCDKCRLCFFTSKISYDQHMEEHRLNPDLGKNETPPCEVCGKVLRDKNGLKTHLQVVHGITVPGRVKKVQFKAKKKRTKNKVITTDDDDESGSDSSDSDLSEFTRYADKTTLQVKIEPELTIEPDAIKTESHDFQTYDQIGKHETN